MKEISPMTGLIFEGRLHACFQSLLEGRLTPAFFLRAIIWGGIVFNPRRFQG